MVRFFFSVTLVAIAIVSFQGVIVGEQGLEVPPETFERNVDRRCLVGEAWEAAKIVAERFGSYVRQKRFQSSRGVGSHRLTILTSDFLHFFLVHEVLSQDFVVDEVVNRPELGASSFAVVHAVPGHAHEVGHGEARRLRRDEEGAGQAHQTRPFEGTVLEGIGYGHGCAGRFFQRGVAHEVAEDGGDGLVAGDVLSLVFDDGAPCR